MKQISHMDTDLDDKDREWLIAEIIKLRGAIREQALSGRKTLKTRILYPD